MESQIRMINSEVSIVHSQLQLIRSVISFALAFIAACLMLYVPLFVPVDVAGNHAARILLGFAAPSAVLAYWLKI